MFNFQDTHHCQMVQMIKPQLPHSYNRCLERTASHHATFSLTHTHLNMPALTTVTGTWESWYEISYNPGTCSFRYPHRKKAIRVTPNQGGHVIDPWFPIHFHRYVTFNHCCTSSSQCTGAPVCWNHNLYLTAIGTPSTAQVEQFSGNHGTAEHSTCQIADRPGPQQCPQWFQPECFQ
jgi:hypothetical protein